MIDQIFWWVGFVVCASGGLFVATVALYAAFEKIAQRYTNTAAVVRVMRYARRNGIDLATGKPCEPDDIPAE